MKELEGKTLDQNYFLRKFVDSGGMADVYNAWDRRRTTQMAVKVLRRDLAANRRFYEMFKKEAELLHKLEHPNIVRLYEFERDGDIVFIVMDWVDGENVRQVILRRKKPFSIKETSRILGPVCSALNFAHQSDIFHCDVKPANILLHVDGRVLLTDFGVARHAMETTWGGTPAYMAPEQFPELPYSGRVDARTDVYSLGVTLYEMLSGGWVPYRGDSPSSLGEKTRERIAWEIQNTPLPPLNRINPGVSEAVEKVIRTALCKDPAGRYSSTMELLEAFEHARTIRPRGGTGPQTIVHPVPPPISQPSPSPPLPSQPLPPPVSTAPSPAAIPSVAGPHLFGRTGEWAGKVIEITREGLGIGRSSSHVVQIREPSVSRTHASIVRKRWGKTVYIRDENSSMGVLVNGQSIPVAVLVQLKHGDVIQIGHYQVFEFRES